MRRRTRGRRRPVGRAALVGLALATSVASACGAGEPAADGAGPATATTPGPVPTTAAPGTWTRRSAAPIANRSGFVNVWTGTELLICCGAPTRADSGTAVGTQAAAYDPANDRWRTIAPPPTPVEAWGAIAVVDRTVYFFDGGTRPWTYAAYDIDADRWRLLPAPPGTEQRSPNSRMGPAVWTGTEIVAPITTMPAADHDTVMMAYNPATATWRMLPTPPVRLEPSSLTWDGTRMQLLGELHQPGSQTTDLVSATYDPATNTWAMPESTPVDRRDPVVVADGEGLLAWDVTGAVRVNTNGSWRDLAPLPLPEDECGWRGTRLGPQLVMFRCTQQGAVLDPATGTWQLLAPPPSALQDGNIVALGDRLLLWDQEAGQLTPWELRLPASR